MCNKSIVLFWNKNCILNANIFTGFIVYFFFMYLPTIYMYTSNMYLNLKTPASCHIRDL